MLRSLVVAALVFAQLALAVAGVGIVSSPPLFINSSAVRTLRALHGYSLQLNGASTVTVGSTLRLQYETPVGGRQCIVGLYAERSISTSTYQSVKGAGVVSFETASLPAGRYVANLLDQWFIQAQVPFELVEGSTSSPPPSSGGAPPFDEVGTDAATWLQEHNRRRAAASPAIPPLKWSDALAQSAQAYARQLANSPGCPLRHSSGHGENLAKGQQSISEVMVDWADQERPDYDPVRKTCMNMCGHYTQVMWRSTEWLGCGSAPCRGSGAMLWVCQYIRPGNCNGYDFQQPDSPCPPFAP